MDENDKIIDLCDKIHADMIETQKYLEDIKKEQIEYSKLLLEIMRKIYNMIR